MGKIIIIVGSKENLTEDIKAFSEKLSYSQKVQMVSKKDMKQVLLDKASSLFMEEDLTLVLVDPDRNQIKDLEGHIQVLKDRMTVIIYTYAPLIDPLPLEGAVTFVVEKEKEKRIKERVLSLLKKHGKVLTDKGFARFKEKIKDEAFLESELMKLINYVGERKEIKSGDVDTIVTETHEENLLNFFEIIAKRDKKGVIEKLEMLIESGLNILEIQAFLIRQARLMLHGKDMEDLFRTHKEYSAFLKVFNRWKDAFDDLEGDRKLYLPFQNRYYAFKIVNTGLQLRRGALIDLLDRFAYTDRKLKRGSKHDRIYLEESLIEV
ncbi:MAG: hypothetical protein N2745_02265 [Syntrophorhabdaceae bacterium]|nr:hypothetical protein [Syntrophorhabdaceae bacterium]